MRLGQDQQGIKIVSTEYVCKLKFTKESDIDFFHLSQTKEKRDVYVHNLTTRDWRMSFNTSSEELHLVQKKDFSVTETSQEIIHRGKKIHFVNEVTDDMVELMLPEVLIIQ